MKIQHVIAIHHMRWLTNFYDFRFKSTATAAIGIHPTKAWLSQLVNFKNAIWTWGHFRRTICNKIVLNLEKKCHRNVRNASDCFWIILQESPRPKKARQQIHEETFDDPFFDGTGMIYMHWVPTGQTVNKEYYVEVLREFRKRFRRKSPALLKLDQWHFHLDNAPVHNSILVTDYLTKMGIKTVTHPPYSTDLAPYDFWLFPKLKEKLSGCRYHIYQPLRSGWIQSFPSRRLVASPRLKKPVCPNIYP